MAIDAGAWLKAYGAAWESHDGDAAAALFSKDGTYCWGPVDPPLVGRQAIRERWDAATADQGRVRFSSEVLGRDGDRVFARWWVSMTPPDGPETKLDGIFVLDFAPDGQCRRLQEWWIVLPQEGA